MGVHTIAILMQPIEVRVFKRGDQFEFFFAISRI